MILCMTPTWYGVGKSSIISWIVFATLLSIDAVPANQWDTQGAALAFDTATQMRSEIAAAKQPVVSQYLKCARTYRKVYLKDPHYRRAGNAIYEEGLLYREMGDKFGNLEYYRTAAKRFNLLVKDYGGHANCPDALLILGVLYTKYLNNESEAQKVYQRLRTQYRQSKAAYLLARLETVSRPVPPQAATAVNPAASAQKNETAFIQSIRYWSTQDYTRVIVDLDRNARYDKNHVSDPDRVYIDISDVRLSKDLSNHTIKVGDGFLERIRAARNRADRVRVVLDLAQSSEYSVSELYDPFRIVIDLYRSPDANPVAKSKTSASRSHDPRSKVISGGIKALETVGPAVAASPKAAIPTSRGDRTLTRMLGLKIGRIVIDPGHGGHDIGTAGPGGLIEKDLVLSLARELRKLLQERLGAEVFLTRNDDTFVSLEERTTIANEHRADLFISIHANSSRNHSISGVETYYLDFAKTESEREVASRENASSSNNVRDLEDLIKKIAQADKSSESRELASIVQKNLYTGARRTFSLTQDRGVRKAPFIVLIGANMPSVLVEVAFISNPQDERLMKKQANQALIAGSLFNGIESYMRSLGSDEARMQPSQK